MTPRETNYDNPLTNYDISTYILHEQVQEN